MEDKQKPSALVIALMKKHGDDKSMGADAPEASMPEEAVSPDELDAAQDLIDAMKRGSAKEVALAMKDFATNSSSDDSSAGAAPEPEAPPPQE